MRLEFRTRQWPHDYSLYLNLLELVQVERHDVLTLPQQRGTVVVVHRLILLRPFDYAGTLPHQRLALLEEVLLNLWQVLQRFAAFADYFLSLYLLLQVIEALLRDEQQITRLRTRLKALLQGDNRRRNISRYYVVPYDKHPVVRAARKTRVLVNQILKQSLGILMLPQLRVPKQNVKLLSYSVRICYVH